MNTKDQKFIHKWSKQLQRGKTNYVITYGVAWGIMAAVISTLFRLGSSTLAELYLSGAFLIKLIVMIAVGLFFQNWQWNFNSKKYHQLLEQHPNHTPDQHHRSAS